MSTLAERLIEPSGSREPPFQALRRIYADTRSDPFAGTHELAVLSGDRRAGFREDLPYELQDFDPDYWRRRGAGAAIGGGVVAAADLADAVRLHRKYQTMGGGLYRNWITPRMVLGDLARIVPPAAAVGGIFGGIYDTVQKGRAQAAANKEKEWADIIQQSASQRLSGQVW